MKRFFAIAILLFTALPNAQAVIAPKPMTQLAQVDGAAIGVVASGNQIMVFGNREKNGFAQFLNGPTVELTSGLEPFVSAATVDPSGNFYLFGASSNPIVGTLPPISGVLNPDDVVPDPVSSNKSDAVNLIYWKFDISGNLLDTQTMLMPFAMIPNAAIVDASGITVAGSSYNDPGSNAFVVNWSAKPIFIGRSFTTIFAISRSSDGGVFAVGQSRDKLLNTILKGRVDGFVAKLSNNKLLSVQRSSDTGANRAWRTTTSNLLLGGNSNSSAVITKFDNNFAPQWTSRYPSNGPALTANVGKVNYGAFVSMGSFKSLPIWKKKNAILVLAFDSKGQISGANYVNSPQLTGFTANSSLGPIVLSGGFLYRT